MDQPKDERRLPAFLVWRTGRQMDGVCKTGQVQDQPSWERLEEGAPQRAGWPAGVHVRMSERFPKDKGLADSLNNQSNYVIVSAKVKAFLEQAGALGGVELLPLAIIDHRGKVASADYFIVHPTTIVDCIDIEASEAKVDAGDGRVTDVKRLALREDAVPADVAILRLGRWTTRIVLRRTLADQLQKAGLTGLVFVEPDRYRG